MATYPAGSQADGYYTFTEDYTPSSPVIVQLSLRNKGHTPIHTIPAGTVCKVTNEGSTVIYEFVIKDVHYMLKVMTKDSPQLPLEEVDFQTLSPDLKAHFTEMVERFVRSAIRHIQGNEDLILASKGLATTAFRFLEEAAQSVLDSKHEVSDSTLSSVAVAKAEKAASTIKRKAAVFADLSSEIKQSSAEIQEVIERAEKAMKDPAAAASKTVADLLLEATKPKQDVIDAIEYVASRVSDVEDYQTNVSGWVEEIRAIAGAVQANSSQAGGKRTSRKQRKNTRNRSRKQRKNSKRNY